MSCFTQLKVQRLQAEMTSCLATGNFIPLADEDQKY
jgi:hypothetical protein